MDQFIENLRTHIAPEQLSHFAKMLSLMKADAFFEFKVLDRDSEDPKDFSQFRIQVKQTQPTRTGRIFTQKEIVTRAQQLFADLRFINYRIVPVTFSPDFSIVTTEWINQQMNDLGLKNSDVGRQTGINKSTLSLFFTGKKNLTLMHKALLWYYFHSFRVSRDLLQVIDKLSEMEE